MVYTPRTRMISFRITEDEFERLQNLSASQGARSVSDYARVSLCGGDAALLQERIEAKIHELDGKLLSLTIGLSDLRVLVEKTHDAVKGQSASAASGD